MKYLILFFIISCAHNSKERCSSDVALEVAQCFIDDKQPIRALTLSEHYLKKNQQTVEWTLISFESYLGLGNEKRAVSAIQKGIKNAPHMKYFETLITHFEKKNPEKV